MIILGISAFYHDAAATLLIDGEVVAAAQEERFTRVKHDPSFPVNAIRFCLEFASIAINDLDAVAFYDKPLLKFERLLETYYAYAPSGLRSFVTAMPVWIKEKMFLKKQIWSGLDEIEKADRKRIKLLFPEHHLSHAASAFYPSRFEKAAILTIDGVGEWATASICLGEGKNIKILRQLDFPHSLGLLYSAFTYFCGFRVNSGEYKLMGLAPYGNAGSREVENYIDLIREHLIDIRDDGSIFLHQAYFSYATGLRMVKDKKWEKIFGIPRRDPESRIEQCHCDLALAIQTITEEVVIKLGREAKRLTNCDHLTMAGGVALNCVANGKLDQENIFKEIFITPAAGDAGGSLGAAYAAYHIYYEKERTPNRDTMDALQGAYLGTSHEEKEILAIARRYQADFEVISSESKMVDRVAQLTSEGNIIGWHQGRMEFGPRALGARSILGDARNPEMQKKLNLKIKYRESFRPFAPVVPAEDVSEYFDHQGVSPYMLMVKKVRESRCVPYPEAFEGKDLFDKLYFLRSDIPSITHIDYSARLQTVHQETNPRFWKLLMAFKKITGYSVLVNTSFNVRGEPIVNTPEDSYRCFMRTDMDYLVVENILFEKSKQPPWKEKDDWRKEFVLD